MSSEEEEENFCFFGKPLDPYDEDSIPKKRPISVEEQIATDAQGRRRFHGAFTGGFSAGFFNTVGSLEGWTPSDFKSSRVEKAKQVVQNPVDFMDQEDLSEYGIAPQTIRATKDYSTSKKRRKQMFSEGPIPGEPVLETLLTSGNETIGYLLLKKIGIKDKIKARDDEFNADTKTYGCQKPDQFKVPEVIKNKQYKIPAIYTDCLKEPKSNTFGLEYKGLEKSHVNLFSSSNLVIRDKNDKKFSIGGQAFGVGAFEEDDDDIYMKEDMSNYDFELTKEKKTDKHRNKEASLIFGMFKRSNVPLIAKKSFPPPVIPHSFTGKHKVKKSRFEQIEVKTETEETSRNEINPAIRARYLGEEVPENYTTSRQSLTKRNDGKTTKKESKSDKNETEQTKTDSFMSSLMEDKFVAASNQDDLDILEPEKKNEILHGTKDMREAAKMKMYGQLTRVSADWAPCSLLCKRFNVPEPSTEPQELKNRKRTKNLIFESQKTFDDTSALFKPGCSIPSTSTEEIPLNLAGTEDIVAVKTERTSPIPNESESNENVNKPETVVKDITDKIGVEENVDLFKAVFQSSESESEEEQEEEKADKQTEDFKETILFDLVPKIRPLKQGILSNISFQRKQNTTDTNENPITESKTSSYGPQLPRNSSIFPSTSSNTAATNLNHSDDEWIEKDSKREHKKSKHKKDKKKKHKHKKSKDK